MVRMRLVVVVTLLALIAFVLPAAQGQEGFDDPDLPPGTVTVVGEFTSGKFLDPGTMATSADQTLIYWEYDLVDHDLVFWVFPSVGGEPTTVIGYGEVAQRHEWEIDHFINDEPATTRRAYTAITEMDFEGTWDGNDPGRVKGTVTWTVPEERVDVEWNEHSWGPVPSPTNGIFTGPGPDGVFTASWLPTTGEMRGEIDTGPWDGGFEAFAVPTEPAATPTGISRLSVPCFFDTAPGTTPACGGENPAQGSGLGLLTALTHTRLQPSAAREIHARTDRNDFKYELPARFESTVAGPALAGALMRPRDGSDEFEPPFPVFVAAAPLFRSLALAELTAKDRIENKRAKGEEPTAGELKTLARVQRTSQRLIRLITIWEVQGFMPPPTGGS